MTMKVIAQQGDTLDLLCYRHYSQESTGIVETVLNLNSQLAEFGPVLPLGTVVILPEQVPTAADNTMVQLWD